MLNIDRIEIDFIISYEIKVVRDRFENLAWNRVESTKEPRSPEMQEFFIAAYSFLSVFFFLFFLVSRLIVCAAETLFPSLRVCVCPLNNNLTVCSSPPYLHTSLNATQMASVSGNVVVWKGINTNINSSGTPRPFTNTFVRFPDQFRRVLKFKAYRTRPLPSR